MNKRILTAGVGASVLLLGLIVGLQDRLFPAPGFCRQCECAVYETDDAGTRQVRSVVLSFGGEDLAPDASVDSLTDKACLRQARQICGVPAGEQVADQPVDVRRCVQRERETCAADGMARTMACRACAPARACSQAEPVAVVARASSEFNCACAIQRYDAGACREPVPYADAGPFFRASPPATTLVPERAIGPGCLRGLPCVELGEIRAKLGEGYPVPEVCRPWPGPDAGPIDASTETPP